MRAVSLLALLAALPVRAFWLGPSSESRRADAPIPLDESASRLEAREGDESDGMAYAFANDDKDLYIYITPHTKTAKEQMAGIYGQDLYLWFEPPGKGRVRAGLELPAPESPGTEEARAMKPVGLEASTSEARLLPLKSRGGLAARVPLKIFGATLPKKIFVGLEASSPKRVLPRATLSDTAWTGQNGQVQGAGSPGGAKPDVGRQRPDGSRRPGGGDGSIDLLQLWVQVTLAPAPGPR